jgi:hypothetical protein
LDYEAPANIARQYRAKTAGLDFQIDPVNGAYLVSGPSGLTLSSTLTVAHFYLVDPFTQTRIQVWVRPGQQYGSEQPQGVYQLAGRSYKTVLSGQRTGKDLSLTIYIATLADLLAWEAMLATDHVLYYQTPMDRSWYFKVLSQVTTELMNSPDDIALVGGCYQVTLQGAEVARPLL